VEHCNYNFSFTSPLTLYLSPCFLSRFLFLSLLINFTYHWIYLFNVKLFGCVLTDMETNCFWCLWLYEFHQTCFSVCNFFFLFPFWINYFTISSPVLFIRDIWVHQNGCIWFKILNHIHQLWLTDMSLLLTEMSLIIRTRESVY